MNERPLVLCLTNTVAAPFTANGLLAFGATPAMLETPDEAAELAPVADAILVNVGTLTPGQADTMRAAIAAARKANVPWVLDPVAVDKLAYRRRFILELLDPTRASGSFPALIRGNRSEILFLKDRMAPNADPIPETPLLATGPIDEIWRHADDEAPAYRIEGGVATLARVTATGCLQGALAAACLGRGESPLDAALHASRLMKKAGERAYAHAQTPGSFQIALLDALGELA